MLEKIRDALNVGVKGVAIGRNIFQAEDPQAMCQAVAALIHEDVSIDRAMEILTGRTAVEPCPICGKGGTKLSALSLGGQCYGSCGKVKLAQLYDLVLTPRATGKEGQGDA